MSCNRIRSTVASTLLIGLITLWPVPVRAEIVDFDPDRDLVPEILDPQEMALVDTLLDVKQVAIGPIRPDGGALLFASTSDLAGHPPASLFRDLLEVDTGRVSSLETPVPSYARWVDANRLVWFESRSGEPVQRVELDLRGEVMSRTAIDWLADEPYVLWSSQSSPDASQYLLVGWEDDPSPLVRGRSHLALIDADGRNRRELGALPGSVDHVVWSDDASRIAIGTRDTGVLNALSFDETLLEIMGRLDPRDNPWREYGLVYGVFDTRDGRERLRLDRALVADGRIWRSARLSPAGRWLQFTVAMPSHLDDRPHPTYQRSSHSVHRIVEVETGQVRDIEMAMDPSIQAHLQFEDEENLLIANQDGMDSVLLRHEIDSGRTERIWDRPGSIDDGNHFFQRVANRMLFVHESFDEPAEIWLAEGPDWSASARPVTSVNENARLASRLASLEVEWTDEGGRRLSGRLIYREDQPPSAQARRPVVVWQIGGPDWHASDRFGHTAEAPTSILANLGLPVFVANVAGRAAGDADLHALLFDDDHFGQVDVRQLQAGVEALIEQGLADAGRIGITGCSYGGFLAWQSLVEAPGTYAAANPQCSLVDLASYWASDPQSKLGAAYWMGSSPDESPGEYRRDSPYRRVDEIRVPTLVFHGTLDSLPIDPVIVMHDALEAGGQETRMLRFRDERHGLFELSSQRLAVQEQVRFFRHHLAGVLAQPTPIASSTPDLPATEAPATVTPSRTPSSTPTPIPTQVEGRLYLPWLSLPTP